MKLGLLWPQSAAVWNAGDLYFGNVLRSCEMAAARDEQVVVIDAEQAPAVLHRKRLFRRDAIVTEPAIVRAVRASGADVVFGDANQMEEFPVPWIGWIPDFQHRVLPEYFAPAEVAGRDEAYLRMAGLAVRVLLSSEDARGDFERFAPEWAHKARVAPFVSLIPDDIFDVDPGDTVARLGVVKPFVLVPNQWWRHKDHETAIRAAALLKGRGADLAWVFTGALTDYRAPDHVAQLLELIPALGLDDDVMVLGMLPRGDQLQLMRAAEMVVQPSLFEGWSTVVEDARTLGQRIVLSDLDVHREQDPPAALFFERRSVEDLADQVQAMLDGAFVRPDEDAAREDSLARARVFGRRFLDIAAEAAGERTR